MKKLPTIIIGKKSSIDLSKPKKRTIDRSKPKVTLGGQPAPDCIQCRKNKPTT